MRRTWLWRGAAAVAIYAALAYPGARVQMLCVREGYRLSELVGIMDPGGALGGQILGFNYQREPGWVHRVLWTLGAAAGYGPGLVAALGAATPGVWRGVTMCGRCGRWVRGVSGGRCPHCGGEFA